MKHSRPAYSLIFAFIMMTLIMVIASTSIQDTRNKLRLFRDLEASSQARLAAESAAELGIVALNSGSFDAETEQENEFCLENSDRSGCQSTGSYTIYPYATENSDASDGLYYLPIPGTGTAAPTEDCSILDDDQDIDHACNWNKLTVGESVTIPLYYEDGYGSRTFPDTMGLTGWYLRMRTPCMDGDLDCDAADRYVISNKSAGTYRQTSDNPAVVLWEMVAETSTGSVNMIPSDSLDSSSNRSLTENTEIYEGNIQVHPYDGTLSINDVLLPISSSIPSLYSSLSTLYSFIQTPSYTNLYFSMNTINRLEATDGTAIPYLEYQVVIDASNGSPMASTAEIIGEGYYESGEYTYYFPYVVSKSNTDTVTTLYTLSN